MIVNGPCKADIIRYLKKYLIPTTHVIVLGTHVKTNGPSIQAIRSLLPVVKESSHAETLGYLVLRNCVNCVLLSVCCENI